MEDLAPEFQTIGLTFLVTGPLMAAISFLLARNPAFPAWTGIAMKYAGVGLTLLGAIYYFQPGGAEPTIHAGTLIILGTGALAFWSVRRHRNRTRGASPR